MPDQFSRTQLVIGTEGLALLGNARVAVFGIGGVGGYAAEALARSGVGAIDLIDHDRICESNINRQITATFDVIGRYKVDVMAERIVSINPLCRVKTHKCFYLPANADDFDLSGYDYIIDAVDTVTAKLCLARAAQEAGTPLISSMGAANKIDPTAFRVADIFETRVCPLAKIIRKECRKRGIDGYKVVYSEEPARKPIQIEASAGDVHADGPQAIEAPPPGRRSIPGSVAFVPSVAGLICAAEVVKDLAGILPETESDAISREA